MSVSRFLTSKSSSLGCRNLGAANQSRPLFILNRCERSVSMGSKNKDGGAFPLARFNLSLFFCYPFCIRLFEALKRQFQLWCCDCFHGRSVSRSAKPVTRQSEVVCHA